MSKGNRKSLTRREFDLLIDTIRQTRERQNLSQSAVARKIGLDVATYWRIENKERVLDVIEFFDIAQALGVDPSLLFGDFLVAVQAEIRQ